MAVSLPRIDRFSLHVTVYIKEEDVPAFFELFQPIFDLVGAEPELLYFELFQDPENPGVISWVENWNMSPENFMKVRNQLPSPED